MKLNTENLILAGLAGASVAIATELHRQIHLDLPEKTKKKKIYEQAWEILRI